MTVQLALAASVALEQVPPLVNLGGAAGYAMLVALALPVLETVIVCAALVWPMLTLPNDSDVGDAWTLGAVTATPVPDSAIGMLMPVPVMAYGGAKVPAAAGLNVNITVQLAPAASEPLAQVPAFVKLAGAAG